MRTTHASPPTRRTTRRRTGGTPSDLVDPLQFASGEKVAEFSERSQSEEQRERATAELRRRYDAFETVLRAMASMIVSSRSPVADPSCEPSRVKFHSLRELSNGRIPKDDVLRILYECAPLCERRFTRDELLDRPFRDICGLPDFLDDYRYERMGLYDEEEDDDDEDGVVSERAVRQTRRLAF